MSDISIEARCRQLSARVQSLDDKCAELEKDAERFAFIATAERTVVIGKFLIQVISGDGSYHHAYFAISPVIYEGITVYPNKLSALRAAVDSVMSKGGES